MDYQCFLFKLRYCMSLFYTFAIGFSFVLTKVALAETLGSLQHDARYHPSQSFQ